MENTLDALPETDGLRNRVYSYALPETVGLRTSVDLWTIFPRLLVSVLASLALPETVGLRTSVSLSSSALTETTVSVLAT